MITPSTSPVVWLPHAPAVGGEGSAGVADLEAATLGQFLRSHEDITQLSAPKCKGLARPVFEMEVGPGPAGSAQGAYALMPGLPAGWNALVCSGVVV